MKNLAEIKIMDQFLGSSHPLSKIEGVGSLVSWVVNFAFVLAGLALLVFFIVGGIGLISSAGQSNPEKIEKSKQTISSAVIGFIVVFAAYWIVKLIEQITGIPILS